MVKRFGVLFSHIFMRLVAKGDVHVIYLEEGIMLTAVDGCIHLHCEDVMIERLRCEIIKIDLLRTTSCVLSCLISYVL